MGLRLDVDARQALAARLILEKAWGVSGVDEKYGNPRLPLAQSGAFRAP